MLLGLACTEDGPPPGTPPPTLPSAPVEPPALTGSVPTVPLGIVSGPTVRLPDAAEVRLVQILEVATDRPSRATLVLDDGARRREIAFPDLATSHVLPLLALTEDTAYEVEVTLVAEDGGKASAGASFETRIVPDLLPERELLVALPDAEPGIRILPCTGDEPEVDPVVVALDVEGRLVWAFASPGDTRALSFAADGTFGALVSGNPRRFDPTGNWIARYEPAAVADTAEAIPVDVTEMHHEFVVMPDGSFWTFDKVSREVDEFPVSVLRLDTYAPATLSDDQIVHVAADGTVLERYSLADRLDDRRVGYDSFDHGTGGVYDWGHANAIVPLDDDDAVIASVRHQDTVVKIRRSTGEVVWILANPDGWTAEHEALRLQPVGSEFGWNYHQHAPALRADGTLVMFDNGNFFRTTPYSKAPEDALYTRVVAFEIDETRREVSQAFSAIVGGDFPLYTDALGNADPLPVTGHVLATFPWLLQEDGVVNADVGKGDRSLRLVEIDPTDGRIVWDLRMWSDAADSAIGWQADRGIVVASLYPTTVTERWLE